MGRRAVKIYALGLTTCNWYEAEYIENLTMDEALEQVRRAFVEYGEENCIVKIY